MTRVVPLTLVNSSVLATSGGSVHVESGGVGSAQLVAITPIGARGLSETLPEQLGELFTVHVVELPGTGRSGGDPGKASVASVVGVIKEVATTIAGVEAVLFGHSMNGTLALATAAAMECGGVIAVGAPPCLPPSAEQLRSHWELEAEPERRRKAEALIAEYEQTHDAAARAALRERYDRLRRWHDLEFDPTEIDALAEVDMRWVEAIFEDAASVDWDATLRAVVCPALLVFGASDFLAPAALWNDDLHPPRTTVEVFARSGHTPFFEEPSEFVRASARWLAATRDGRA